MLRLTIAQRLWLGLGLILALFAVADLVSLRAANSVDVALQTLVSGGDERRGAGYNMRSELAAMVRSVQAYQNERDPRQRVRLSKSEKAFEEALTSYNAATSAERAQTLAQQLHKLYAGFKRQGHEVMRLKDARALTLYALAVHQGTVDVLLASMPLLVVPAHQVTTGQTGSQTKELANALRAAAVDLDQRMQAQGEAFEVGMASKAQQILTGLSRYKKSAQTSAERIWADKADRWYAELTGRVNAFLKADAVYEKGADQFTATARKLEDILTESIQPAARAELAGAVAQASDRASSQCLDHAWHAVSSCLRSACCYGYSTRGESPARSVGGVNAPPRRRRLLASARLHQSRRAKPIGRGV